MVMESRKAAPALRARLLRSYVPLRRDPSESVLSGTIPGLPGGLFSTHKFKLKGEKKVWRETEIDGKIRQMARRNLLNRMRLRRVRKGEQKMGTYMEALAKHAKSASREAAKLGTDEKNRGLLAVAEELIAQQELILEENKKDLEAAKEKGVKQSLRDSDRLRLWTTR